MHAHLTTQAASYSRWLYIQLCIEQLTGQTNVSLTAQVYRVFERVYLQQLQPGIKSLLVTLRKTGLKLALVTALVTDLTLPFQISKIQWLRLSNLIDILVTSEEVGIEKPHPKMIQVALRKLNVTKSDVVLIGDSSQRDQTVAQRSGVKFLRLAHDADVARVRTVLLNN